VRTPPAQGGELRPEDLGSPSARPVVLVVDDDAGVRFTLAEVLLEADVEVLEAADGRAALAIVRARPVDLVITDLRMPGMDGLELLREVIALRPGTRVVLITAHGSEAHAVAAMKAGAYDYFSKPFEIEEVMGVVRRATETVRLGQENRRLRAELGLARHMVFRSEGMSHVAQIVERVAPRDVNVLVSGESGTGKELVAEAIVAASPRAERPFVRFNCAALPRELAEAELFGHTAGAFTGATKARPGLFRQADGGTLFLDEIAELDVAIQGKLLRVLQQGEVKPVGEDRVFTVDVRLIAASNRELEKEVAAGRFREDLFYRLHVVEIIIPPLRERPEDIDPLVDHFLAKFARRFGLPVLRLSAAARDRLRAASYRGNVRELENTVERLVALSDGEGVLDEELGPAAATAGGSAGDQASLGLKERVEAFERGLILEELRRCAGNRSEAARRLRIGRVTLLDKLKKHGIE
jgi:two-component system, NtrC family, response regulator HydG